MERESEGHFSHSPHDDSSTNPLYHPDMKAYNEEMSAEIAVPRQAIHAYPTRESNHLTNDAVRETKSAGRATGWAALILAALSWVVWPVVLGATAIIVGFIAYRQGARGLGVWSITLGFIAAAAYLVLVPLYYAIT
ncbi:MULTISPECIES: DUF4190 domain-containing protein [Paenibacillus]|uniref:DUF4190 domain-containing protein n=1 Tax=Paenibacillus lignilyticus TaxID=1172615 RepID=A0ABS5CE03_9BACL|nr:MULTISPECIES: DUF4190 domain-containing protein [Paenibacillus]MBP3964210.1 DUF4190 domain-containing protein [Paenibacillus lignilyticus]SFS85673.1 hypothetical protein SAMN05428962_3285 [Paenibacillus sp. BC26]